MRVQNDEGLEGGRSAAAGVAAPIAAAGESEAVNPLIDTRLLRNGPLRCPHPSLVCYGLRCGRRATLTT